MKKRLLLFVMALGVFLGTSRAYDFSAQTSSGKTLYYNIVNGGVQVTYPGTSSNTPYSNFSKPTNSLDIPSRVEYNGINYNVIGIGDYAFSTCLGLTSVSIPGSVTSIGQNAFSGCSSLTSVNFESTSSVASIGTYAFRSCSSLTSITIPNSVTSIGNYSFVDCSGLTSVTFNATNCSSGIGAFQSCANLQTLTIGSNVTKIPNYTFSECTSLTSLTIPNSVTSIGSNAFSYCTNLTSVYIGSSVTSIGDGAFEGCNNVTTLNYNAKSLRITRSLLDDNTNRDDLFRPMTSLSTLVIGDSVQQIPQAAFSLSSNLTSVTIGKSVTRIGQGAFDQCNNIANVEFSGNINDWCRINFEGPTSNPLFYAHNLSINGHSVTFADITSATQIGSYSFCGCSSLTGVNIPNSVTNIGRGAFYGCSNLTDVTIPKRVTVIDYRTFYECSSLASVALHSSVQYIYQEAFYNCSSLTSVTIPKRVYNLGESAFSGCSGLTSIIALGTNPPPICQSTFSGVSNSIPVTVPCERMSSYQGATNWNYFTNYQEDCPTYTLYYDLDSVTHTATVYGKDLNNGSHRPAVPRYESDSSLVIPSSISIDNEVYMVTSVGNEAFSCLRFFNRVTIPNSVVSIGNSAFYLNWNLRNAVIPNSVVSIGDHAFDGCLLTSVNIPNSVTNIGPYAFQGCKMTTLTIPNSVTVIGDYAFKQCNSLSSVTIGTAVTHIGEGSFQWCQNLTDVVFNAENCDATGSNNNPSFGQTNISNVTFGNNVTRIPSYAFRSCFNITNVNIPNSVTSIGDEAFSSCGLESVTLPQQLTTIGNGALAGNAYTSISIPNSVTNIGNNAFSYNTSLNLVSIGTSITSIGEGAFSSRNISSLTIKSANPPSLGDNAFENVNRNISVYVPCDRVSNYQAANGWNSFANIQQSPECEGKLYYSLDNTNNTATVYGKSAVGLIAIDYSGSMDTINIPNSITYNNITYSVTAIGNSAFSENGFMKRVIIPNSVTSIGFAAFSGCRALSSVNIGYSVTTIGNVAFNHCISLTRVDIPDAVTSIGVHSFDNCRSLTNVHFGNGLNSIGECAFQECVNLDSVIIPNSVTLIDDWAFERCSYLRSVTIGNSVTRIGNYAFAGCSQRLTGIVIPNSVTNIGNSAFRGCYALTRIDIPSSVINIGESAFADCIGLIQIHVSDENANYDSRDNCNSLIETSTNTLLTGCKKSIIPKSVQRIASNAFSGCSISTLDIPNSVSSIGDSAFHKCTQLTCVVIPSSVTNIESDAFKFCNNIRTVYDLSNLNVQSRTSGNGHVAENADRVVTNITPSGNGLNTIYQIHESYSVVNSDDQQATHIPEADIPDNFIYKEDNGGAKTTPIWKAKRVVLTDGQESFNAPVAFTADSAIYTRTLTDGNRSTLCLPFTTTIPANLEVYTFTGYSNGTLYFNTLGGNTISAYTPYLIGKGLTKDQSTFTFTQANAYFPQTSEATPTYTTNQNGMTFQGVVKRTCMNNTCYGYKDGFFVQSSQGSNYNSVHTDHAHVNPFRCYFTTGDPVSMVLSIDTDGDNLGIDEVDTDAAEETSIRYSTDVYDMMGRMVRKNAETLRGLPKGIYIWKGKKVLAF